jgi:fatty acid desaturase
MIEWFKHVVLGQIGALMQAARDNYSVNPVIFLIIYLGSGPFFYYSIFRMVRALAKRLGNEVMIWSTVFLAATAAPFLYVLFFGRNLPWWVYVIIALLIGQGVFSLVRRLTKKAAPGAAKKKKKAPKG